jgi:mono/diheme cytochrome c family protein
MLNDPMRSLVAGGLIALCGLSGCVSTESVPPAGPPARAAFSRAAISNGALLARIGNCASCHTAPGGTPYAGGRALKTPFGTVYGTNITPDPDTGLGRWSLAAFARAMREGIDREGRHLYPVFPYDHFTHLTDDDIASLYAFIMTRDPVRMENRPDRIPVPRAFVAIWNASFLKKGPIAVRPDRSAEWNRGAYLAEALGHCSACHTPRNVAGAEIRREAYAGGEAEGWHAPALNSASPSPVRWTAEALTAYLQNGIADDHAVTAGPMADVVRNLREVPVSDLRAIAEYFVTLDERPAARSQAAVLQRRTGSADAAAMRGKVVYDGACADCHDRGREAEGGALPLRLAIGLFLPTPRNLAYIIRDGIVPVPGDHGPWMPAYSGALTDAQLADLLVYLRSTTGLPAWNDVGALGHDWK